MSANVLADASFLVAFLNRRDPNHEWATALAERLPPPWKSCEAALTEALYLLGSDGTSTLAALLRRRAVVLSFSLEQHLDTVLALMAKYADVPMSLADACLVRMTETMAGPVVVTTDSDFRIYRRHSRQVIPCAMPDR